MHVMWCGWARDLRMGARVPSTHPWNFLGVEGVPPSNTPAPSTLLRAGAKGSRPLWTLPHSS